MTKLELIKRLKNEGMDFIYQHFYLLTGDQQRELLLSAFYVIGNNNLDSEYFNELMENLED